MEDDIFLRLRNGDKEAEREFISSFGNELRAAIHSDIPRILRGEFDATDFEQMTWQVFTERSQFPHINNIKELRSYLFGIARLKILHEYNRRKKTKKRDAILVPLESIMDSPEEPSFELLTQQQRKEFWEFYNNELNKLKYYDRDIIERRLINGETMKEIAVATHRSKNYVLAIMIPFINTLVYNMSTLSGHALYLERLGYYIKKYIKYK